MVGFRSDYTLQFVKLTYKEGDYYDGTKEQTIFGPWCNSNLSRGCMNAVKTKYIRHRTTKILQRIL